MADIGTVNFGGIASGLDTQKLIDDLIAVDSNPLKRLESRQSDLNEKSTVFTTMTTNLIELKDKAFDIKNASTLGVFSASSSDEEALSLFVSSQATAGNYSVKISSLARAMTLSGGSFEETDNDLGLSGEILINGENFKVRTSDNLIDIRNAINTMDVGVKANILKVSDSDNRLIISSTQQGTEGFHIANAGGTDVLGELGFTDGTTSIREQQNGDVVSIKFSSAGSTIGSQIGLSTEASGTIKIRDNSIAVDLTTDTLSSLRDKINDANITGVTAVVDPVEVDGETMYHLAITGTEDFTDDGNILTTIGILANGTSGTYAEFETSPIYFTDENEVAVNTTRLAELGAVINDVPETITISGTDANGSDVEATMDIQNSTNIIDVLEQIETAFSGDVTASIEDGKIKIRSAVAGETSLDVSITANNENGGTLDFGTISTTVVGRDRLVVAGTDARLRINNIEVTRTSNEINDVLTGLTLNLKKADPDTEINISVEQDQSAIFKKIEGFVESYNKLAGFINEKSKYDQETQEGGILLGDMTSRTTITTIQDVFQNKVEDDDLVYNQLAQVGIELTADGLLKLNASKLNDAMNTNIDGVIELFTISRSSSDNDIKFVYNSTRTKPGTYNVVITQAAEMAVVESDPIEGFVGGTGTITITDDFDLTMNVDYSETMSVSNIANLINEEAQNTKVEIQESEHALLNSDGIPIFQNTAIGDIEGVKVVENDTITITGTNHIGNTFQRIITLSSGDSHTIQDILDIIESLNNDEVKASINSEGRIVIQDKTARASELNLTIETTISRKYGSEGFDFGEFTTVQEGRGKLIVSASVTDDSRLKITHEPYGSEKSFTISGASDLGIADGEYAGVDIAGSINGVEGTGSGQALTASNSDERSRGIVISSDITPEELEIEGPDQGSVTLISGIADRIYSVASSLTQSVDGFIRSGIDGLKMEIELINRRIDNENNRIEQKRAIYVRRFTQMEIAMSKLQSLQQMLTSSLASLPQVSLFSNG